MSGTIPHGDSVANAFNIDTYFLLLSKITHWCRSKQWLELVWRKVEGNRGKNIRVCWCLGHWFGHRLAYFPVFALLLHLSVGMSCMWKKQRKDAIHQVLTRVASCGQSYPSFSHLGDQYCRDSFWFQSSQKLWLSRLWKWNLGWWYHKWKCQLGRFFAVFHRSEDHRHRVESIVSKSSQPWHRSRQTFKRLARSHWRPSKDHYRQDHNISNPQHNWCGSNLNIQHPITKRSWINNRHHQLFVPWHPGHKIHLRLPRFCWLHHPHNFLIRPDHNQQRRKLLHFQHRPVHNIPQLRSQWNKPLCYNPRVKRRRNQRFLQKESWCYQRRFHRWVCVLRCFDRSCSPHDDCLVLYRL